MNLDNNVSSPSVISNVNYKELGATLNHFMVTKGHKPFDLKQISNDAILENEKAFTGADAATGQGLIDTRVVSPIVGLMQKGGVFIESGVNFRDNAEYNVRFNGVRLNGGYAQIACGTDTENEISTFTNTELTLLRERAEIAGCEDVLARTPDSNQALAIFEQMLEVEKLRLADVKAAVAITSNASVADIDQTTPLTQGQITGTMLQMIGNISGFEATVGNGPAFYMNSQGFSKFLREQTTTGQFINSTGFNTGMFEQSYQNGRRTTVGLQGYFQGFPVYVTPSILNTYAVNATTKAITAQTGGTSTAVLFGITGTLGIARIGREYDKVVVFSPENDRQSYYEGEVTVGAWTYMASGVIIPAAWNRAAIAL